MSAFFGLISPPIIALAVPALLFCAHRMIRRPRTAAAVASVGANRSSADAELAIVGVAWFLGTWLPFELQSALDSRTSYLYYMVIVMPGIYVAVTYLISQGWRRRRRWLRGVILAWGLTVLVAVILMYPFVAAF